MNWYQYTKTQLASELHTNLNAGLAEAEAARRLLQDGPNTLPEKPQDSWWLIFLRQFQSPLIYVLLACAGCVYLLGEPTDAIIIVAVLLLNAVIGVVQEGRSGRVLQSLKKLSLAEATVLRGGEELILRERDVVQGDILILQEGQKVAADARVVFSYKLGLDESALTGESGAVLKKDGVLSEEKLPASGQHNMVFKGTSVLTGNGKALVVATGVQTELGKISRALLQPESEIPLQRNIRLLSRFIIVAIVLISAALFALGLSAGRSPREMFALVVSLAVSIIPEGLPLVLTVILAHGVWRMSKRNALVKKLQAVEALGQANVLAVDKTGTVTENQMAITKLFTGGKIYSVTGNGYEPKGVVTLGGVPQQPLADVTMAATIASLTSTAAVLLDEATGQYKVSGDPTEAAMSVFAEKLCLGKPSLLPRYKEVAEIPFDYKSKFRAVFYEHGDKVLCTISGAPEVVFRHSSHMLDSSQARAKTAEDHKRMEQVLEEFSGEGLRVVAFGYKRVPKTHPFDSIADMVFGGLFGIQDAVRPQARQAIELAEKAGLRVVMITGDHKTTAKAIAKQAGIFHEGDEVVTGAELGEFSAEQLAKKLPKVSVFARVTPEDKMKIIEAYKRSGLIVAMTGDGVNDAPSLVAADLGVAMGKIGTEVAKEAADIVLLDDNMLSIVTAIEEGRVMYQNIKKSLQFLFSTSLGELFSIVAALALGLPLPVTAVQILWLNLVTDPLTGASLALEKGEREVVGGKKGFVHDKYFLDWRMGVHMVMVALLMAAGALLVTQVYSPIGREKAMTVALTTLAAFQWFNGFNCRFLQRGIFGRQLFGNRYVWASFFINFAFQLLAVYSPVMNKLLKTTPLSAADWVVALGIAFSVILADEIRKAILRLHDRRQMRAKAAGK